MADRNVGDTSGQEDGVIAAIAELFTALGVALLAALSWVLGGLVRGWPDPRGVS